MRITGLSFGLLALCFAVLAAEETPRAAIAGIAVALSEGDPDAVLSYFDSQMKDFGAIEANVEAITAQTDVSCALDIVSDDESAGVHKLDVDWFMEMKTQGNTPQLERRRERVQIEMRQIKGRWKITALKPLAILAPIQIR